jgi:hypothetical protein
VRALRSAGDALAADLAPALTTRIADNSHINRRDPLMP